MPYFKDVFAYQQSASAIFEQISKPESAALHSGIYRCSACGFEIAIVAGSVLPSTANCSSHGTRWKCKEGNVAWRLVAATIDTNG